MPTMFPKLQGLETNISQHARNHSSRTDECTRRAHHFQRRHLYRSKELSNDVNLLKIFYWKAEASINVSIIYVLRLMKIIQKFSINRKEIKFAFYVLVLMKPHQLRAVASI